MTIIIASIGLSFLSMYGLWVFYLAVMNLNQARLRGTLPKAALVVAYPVLWIGLFLDFSLNMLVMTVVLLEIPREWLVTPRVARHKFYGSGYRKVVAAWMCDTLLDPFDPAGCHCKR